MILLQFSLHGERVPEFCRGSQKDHFSEAGIIVELIKVFRVKEDFNFDRLTPIRRNSRFLPF